MEMMVKAGAGVVALSWYPPGLSDENGLNQIYLLIKPIVSFLGPQSDPVVPLLLNAANERGIKVKGGKPLFFFRTAGVSSYRTLRKSLS